MGSVLINGLGRSGTSWVMKTFDQHPSVFASHEPEAVLPRALSRRLLETGDAETARAFAQALFACRGLRAMRKRPILRKAYRSAPAHALRVGYMYALSGIGRALPPLEAKLRAAPVPDLARMDAAIPVVKSVAQQADIARIAESAPEIRVIYLVRHPCGQVFSMQTGQTQGRMTRVLPPPRAAMAAYLGVAEADLPADETLSATELLAQRWAVYTDINVRRAQSIPNMQVVTYESLCADPIAGFRALFDWAGVDWHPDCGAFLEQSLDTEDDGEAYHALIRNPLVAANKWRSEMPAEDAETVRAICRRSAAAALFDDL